MFNELLCKKHGTKLKCLAGCSAHDSNWYCPECAKELDTTSTHRRQVVMPYPIHTVTIENLSDLEACCKRWRELGATAQTPVVIENNFTLDVTGSLQEHHSSKKLVITLDQLPA